MWQMVNKSSIFAEEYRVWHTPVISAYLFWRFATMYMSPGKGIKREAPSCIFFFILGGILRQNALIKNYIIGRKTLITMLKAIKKSGDADLIDTIHNRIRETMSHTSQAIDIAVASGMLEWDFDKATLVPQKINSISGSAKFRDSKYFNRLVSIVENLAKMFSDVPSPSDLAALLKVRL